MKMFIQIGRVGCTNSRRRNAPTRDDEGRYVRVTNMEMYASKTDFMVFVGWFVDANGDDIPDLPFVRVYEHEIKADDGVVVFTEFLL